MSSPLLRGAAPSTTPPSTTTTTHWITIPTPLSTTHAIPNKRPAIQSPSAVKVSSVDPTGNYGNRRILPAPTGSPIIRVTNPSRASPSSLTIHSNNNTKGCIKRPLGPGALPGAIHKAAVIITNASAADRVVTTQGGINKAFVNSTTTPKAIKSAAPQTSLPGLLLSTSGSAIRLGQSRGLSLVDHTSDGDSTTKISGPASAMETTTDERNVLTNATGSSLVGVGRVLTGALPATPVILHTPVVSTTTHHSISAVQGTRIATFIGFISIIQIPKEYKENYLRFFFKIGFIVFIDYSPYMRC